MTINDVNKNKLEEVQAQLPCSESVTVSENLDDYVSQELAREFVNEDDGIAKEAIASRRQDSKGILEIQGPQENQCIKPYVMTGSYKDSIKDSNVKANTEESKAQNILSREVGITN